MTLQAVALVRIPGFEPDDELDVRELDDGALVFLEVPFESEPDVVIEALADAIGPVVLARHDDERGVFVFPDAADPEAALTYDAVIDAVGELGAFLSLDVDDHALEALSEQVAADALHGALRGTLDRAVSQLGFSSVEELGALLASDDPEALELAQIKMASALERAMAPATRAEIEPPTTPRGGAQKPRR